MATAVKNKIKGLSSKGFFHIFGASVVNKMLAFATNIVIVWFLTKDSYGIFSYANNIYSLVSLVTGFGLLSGMLQFCSEKRDGDEKNAIYRYSLFYGLRVDLVLSIILLVIGLLIPLPIEFAGQYLMLLAPLLLFDYVFQYQSTILRIRKDNKKYAALQLFNSISYFAAGCMGAYVGNIAGTITGRYIAYLLSIGIAYYLLSRAGFTRRELKRRHMSKGLRSELWSYSIPTQISAGLNQLTFLLDVFLVGFFIQNSGEVASYKVATMLPEGLLFIPGSLILFVMPYFIENNGNKDWIIRKTRGLLSASSVLYGLIAFVLVIFAPEIIQLLWGGSYLDATSAFRFLAVCFVFSSLRTTCTNILCALRAVKSNLMISSISALVNVALCVILIPRFGINGAAVAPLMVSAIAFIVALLLVKNTVANISGGSEWARHR